MESSTPNNMIILLTNIGSQPCSFPDRKHGMPKNAEELRLCINCTPRLSIYLFFLEIGSAIRGWTGTFSHTWWTNDFSSLELDIASRVAKSKQFEKYHAALRCDGCPAFPTQPSLLSLPLFLPSASAGRPPPHPAGGGEKLRIGPGHPPAAESAPIAPRSDASSSFYAKYSM